MQLPDRRAEDTETSFARHAVNPPGPGNDAQTTDGRLNSRGDTTTGLLSQAFQGALPVAPEQVPVASDGATVADATALECLQTLDILQATATGRVLVVEPIADTVGRLLREGGFQGQRVALLSPKSKASLLPEQSEQIEQSEPISLVELADPVHPPLAPQDPMTTQLTTDTHAAAGFDHVVVADWLSIAHEELRSNELLTGFLRDQRCQVVVAPHLSRLLPPEDWYAALHWLRELLTPEGFLIVCEPAESIHQSALERELHAEGFLLAADTRSAASDGSWRILRWQYRPSDFSRLPGALTRVRGADLDASVALRQAMIVSYREVFGGDEWGEWMWCVACERHYSRREYEELVPADRCVCGAEHSLETFHPPERVLAELDRDLAEDERSRLYVCIGQTQEIEAFIWGYVTTARRIAEILLPWQGEAERRRLTQRLLEQLARLGVDVPESARIYHQAYIGTIKQVRSFSLPRALFARMCQFALDQGVQLAVTATIPSVNAYALLRGIGMDVVYSYPPLSPVERRQHELPTGQTAGASVPYSRLDESGVVVAGSVHDLLSVLTGSSDRALAKAVGAFLRQQRGGVRTKGAPTVDGGSG